MDKDKKYSVFQNLVYCIKATKKAYSGLLVFCVLIIIINCVIPVITAFLPKVVIEKITEGAEIKKVLIITAILTGTLAVLMAAQEFLDRMIYWHKYKMNAYFLRLITKKGLTTDYKNQEKEHFRKLQSEAFGSCNGNYSYYAQTYDAVVLFFSNLLGFMAFGGILVTVNPLLIIFLGGTTVISFLLNRKIIKWTKKTNAEKVGYEQKMMYIINASEDMQAAKDIRLYNMSVWLNRVYDDNMRGLLGWYRRYTAKLFGVSAVDGVLTLVREGVTYLVLLIMVFNGKISVADFVLLFNVVAGFSAWLSSILGEINNLDRLNLAMNRFRSYLEYSENYKREGGVVPENLDKPKEIRLENVCFRYEESETNAENEAGEGNITGGEKTADDGNADDRGRRNILNNFSLTIEPGEHLAIVGLNGAGKTTLVKLICGLTEPDEGSVSYDGTDVREYNRDEYYRLFGAVFQDCSVLPVTIEEIVGEDTAENVDAKRVEECLRQAGLWEKISSLEKGLKTLYDHSFWDDGVGFSGGETQKLLLARALYRQAPVIILDEPTAALDPLAENRLYETYDELMKGKTTIFISHRLASTRFCSRILLIDGGKVCESGTHEELLAKKGKYYEMFETQAKYYRENSESESTEV